MTDTTTILLPDNISITYGPSPWRVGENADPDLSNQVWANKATITIVDANPSEELKVDFTTTRFHGGVGVDTILKEGSKVSLGGFVATIRWNSARGVLTHLPVGPEGDDNPSTDRIVP